MIFLKVVFFVLAVIFSLLFAYFNLSSVEVSFFKWKYQLPVFLLVFISFVVGFVFSYLTTGIKLFEWRRYGERLRKGLKSLWTGYPDKARGEFAKLLDGEEVVPLYMDAMNRLGREVSLYLQKYSQGIVETEIAKKLLRKETDRAKDLLEKALGKNWNNLTARRLLVGIYFVSGEGKKALDLQRKVVSDAEKPLREKENKVLSSLLAEIEGAEAIEELRKLPLTVSSACVLLSEEEEKSRKKVAGRIFEENIHNEVILSLIQKGALTPEVVREVEENREKVESIVLFLLYSEVGMYERLESLREELPENLKSVADKLSSDKDECYKNLISLLKLFECSNCGKEYYSYSPLCVNCFEWNTLKLKEGAGYVD